MFGDHNVGIPTIAMHIFLSDGWVIPIRGLAAIWWASNFGTKMEMDGTMDATGTTIASARNSPGQEGAGEDPANERLNFLICRIYSKMAGVAGPVHRSLGISLHASQVMMGLLERGPLPIGDLSRFVAIDLSTVSHVLRRLEHDGLALRIREERDNRVVIAKLTEAGNAMAAKCRKMTLYHEEKMFASIPQAERIRFKRMLGKIYENEISAEAEGAFDVGDFKI